MNRTLLGVVAAVAMTVLAACTYERTTSSGRGTFTKHQDGTITGTWEQFNTNTTIGVEGDSVRQIINQLPHLDEQGGVPIQYRYEYHFDVYDTSGAFADTIAVQTLQEFIEMIPVAFELGGLAAPPSETLDILAADAAANWVDPQTHYNLHH